MSEVTEYTIDRGDGARVQLFQARASDRRNGAILFVHGNQGGLLLGGQEAVEDGSLVRFSSRLGVTAAAVSQPGFGTSDGPADFCGPSTQKAIVAALYFLKRQPSVDPERIVLYGNSRGAVASAMVATKVADLKAIILTGGVYDLRDAYKTSARGLQEAIRNEGGLSDEAFLDRSALYHAHSIRSETLLLRGKYDDRASVDQAERFSEALARSGVPVRFHALDGGHRLPRDQVTLILRDFLTRVFAPVATIR
ncbi:alpha/beta hydrolase family protein [Agrobacterium tumefaciens]|uniref:alpha/beta hydrolase family protein n=1 Tax=Agrobacterium tumefaciens TaxID=358 RepID=UPI0015724D73|nr:prolyl oligopeptidase family serine peptidase [Agrobacterium tumefaciens]NTD87744.1 S9 family peptidase [Agrobacterium tumefaciens]NTD91829.1 S9 family peptidase [Agrobacterium tumefaciens]NTD98359.1 S9 family peptidase [Agrobacterium tumefaciens]NTE16147.1 S9 family peptidase [Agrobacterium tumefaciens]NTE21313.1 S9 family peptidase [Agrobacterium tumefaciens]